jgi:hypothetical protein
MIPARKLLSHCKIEAASKVPLARNFLLKGALGFTQRAKRLFQKPRRAFKIRSVGAAWLPGRAHGGPSVRHVPENPLRLPQKTFAASGGEIKNLMNAHFFDFAL